VYKRILNYIAPPQLWYHRGSGCPQSIWDHQRDQVREIRKYQFDQRLTWHALSSLTLSTWLEGLPAALKLNSHSIKSALPHVLTMHLSWASFVIMLHKPFYRPVAQLPSGGPPSNLNAETAVKVSDRGLSCQTRNETHRRLRPYSNAIERLCK